MSDNEIVVAYKARRRENGSIAVNFTFELEGLRWQQRLRLAWYGLTGKSVSFINWTAIPLEEQDL